ncbi:MAG: preprotein translocase subunit YajC [Verrucomicrobia bacterium]|nr:preprotein translocase subunit YajC [Verrucomicrobiota bacterium]
MTFSYARALLAMGPPPAGTQSNPAGEQMKMLGMMVIFALVFYFVMMRPQQKKAKEEAEMRKNIKAGDKILTTSGILGVVVGVKEKSLSIRSDDAKLEIVKSAVAEVMERAGGAAKS